MRWRFWRPAEDPSRAKDAVAMYSCTRRTLRLDAPEKCTFVGTPCPWRRCVRAALAPRTGGARSRGARSRGARSRARAAAHAYALGAVRLARRAPHIIACPALAYLTQLLLTRDELRRLGSSIILRSEVMVDLIADVDIAIAGRLSRMRRRAMRLCESSRWPRCFDMRRRWPLR
eukprot:6205614-Pleurochrysis_carterae.AAC.3